MSAALFRIHPDNPQQRLIEQTTQLLRRGGVIVYPTDSAYALGCHIGDKGAMERFRRIRDLDSKHNFTLVCRDLTEIASYARIGNAEYRILKSLTPGPYTFILRATREVPRRLQNPKRRTIGLRIPDNQIVMALLESLQEPLMSSTLILPGQQQAETDAEQIHEKLKKSVDAVIDGGPCGSQPTTVVDMVDDTPVIKRIGKGNIDAFLQ